MHRRVMLPGLMIGMLLLAGCGHRLATLRYRLTVEVMTPEGLRTGSGVIEVATVDQGKGFPGPEAGGIRRSARGQAVIIETAPRRYLFALLGKGRPNDHDYDYAARLPVTLFRSLIGSGEHPIGPNGDAPRTWLPYDRFHERMIEDHRVWSVPRTKPSTDRRSEQELWPDLVSFDDPTDPLSVRRPDPGTVAIRRVTLQIVDDPVTEGIRSILPWLTDKTLRSLKPQRGIIEDTPAANVVHGDLYRPKALL